MVVVKTQSYLSSEVAMLASLVLHVLAFLGWQNRTVLERFPLFRTLAKTFASAPARPQPAPVTPIITFVQEPAPQQIEDRRQFVETDASQVTGEEPKHARFYSANSTVAANPDNRSGKISETPYLEGKESRLTSTENVVPGPAAAPAARPAPPPAMSPHPASQPSASARPKPPEPTPELAETGLKVVEPKQLALLEKPIAPPEAILPTPPAPPANSAVAAQPLMPPSTLTQVASSNREIAARKSHLMAAGVSRIGISAFNVAGSPFGEYDRALIRAVQSRWYALIEQNGLYEHTGTVVLHFQLLADGTVHDLTTKDNSAGITLGLFCEKAIVESAPFAPLSESLQRLIGGDTREIVFTFYY